MKKVLLITLPLVVLVLIFFNRTSLAKAANDTLYKSPCDAPIHYRIGTIDARFSFSRSEYIIAIDEAGDIWSTVYGKELFVYDPKAEFAINFVYDDRQALNTTIHEENETLQQQDSTLSTKIKEHQRKVDDLHQRFDKLNEEIKAWNAKGGGTEEEFNRLKNQQTQYNQEAAVLNQEAKSLSVSTEKFNAEVQELDETVSAFNEALTIKPEGGLYVRDTSGQQRIDIHIYSTRKELVNILAHELGHALGMEHVKDPQAIMYFKTNEAITLTGDDVQALQAACQKQNIFKTKFIALSYSLRQLIHKINPDK
jgi:peptidoglycan hydrolase CwlO-like protein